MKIYTKTGDHGETGLFGGERVSKASSRVDTYGEIDELNSVLGVVRTSSLGPSPAGDDGFDVLLATIQSRLFDLGAELANAKGKDLGIPLIDDADVETMERAIDAAELEVEPQKTFILPGGTRMAADLHVARCVCRRAERRLVALMQETEVRPVLVRYLNRLSDLLFTLARLANHRANVKDVPWVGRRQGS
ncbi:MAG: cob(I)yrinic acid a,c-diamide adenosyltransferase [Sandaracinaceae bacterium]|nr:cob(I)yrinic acid a,c-diamide adenosyltransferase [Sandaracinaceae bacterium]